jgi:hypothetical protein
MGGRFWPRCSCGKAKPRLAREARRDGGLSKPEFNGLGGLPKLYRTCVGLPPLRHFLPETSAPDPQAGAASSWDA